MKSIVICPSSNHRMIDWITYATQCIDRLIGWLIDWLQMHFWSCLWHCDDTDFGWKFFQSLWSVSFFFGVSDYFTPKATSYGPFDFPEALPEEPSSLAHHPAPFGFNALPFSDVKVNNHAVGQQKDAVVVRRRKRDTFGGDSTSDGKKRDEKAREPAKKKKHVKVKDSTIMDTAQHAAPPPGLVENVKVAGPSKKRNHKKTPRFGSKMHFVKKFWH